MEDVYSLITSFRYLEAQHTYGLERFQEAWEELAELHTCTFENGEFVNDDTCSACAKGYPYYRKD